MQSPMNMIKVVNVQKKKRNMNSPVNALFTQTNSKCTKPVKHTGKFILWQHKKYYTSIMGARCAI